MNFDSKVTYLPAYRLITPSRFDLMAKYVYAENYVNGFDMKWATELYIKHIEAFSGGTYIEPRSKTKITADDYISEFDDIINSVKIRGLSSDISTVPVCEGNVIGNGAHRTAIAHYYNIFVPCRLIDKKGPVFDYRFFQGMFLADKYLDYIALSYVKKSNHKNIFAMIVPAKLYNRIKMNSDYVGYSENHVIFSRSISLSGVAFNNLNIELSMDSDYFDAANAMRFSKRFKCIFFELERSDFLKIRSIVDEMKCDDKKSGLPTFFSRDWNETVRLAELLLNRNSRYLLNYVPITKSVCAKLIEIRNACDNCMNKRNILTDDCSAEIYGISNGIISNYTCIEEINEMVLDPTYYGYRYGVRLKSIYGLSDNMINGGYRQKKYIMKKTTPTADLFKENVVSVKRIIRNCKSYVRIKLENNGMTSMVKLYHFLKRKGFR